MESTLQSTVSFTVKLIHLGFLILDLSQQLQTKLKLDSKGFKGVIQPCQVGVIYRTSRSKDMPSDLVVGDQYQIDENVIVRDVYVRQVKPKTKRRNKSQDDQAQPSNDAVDRQDELLED